MTRRQWLRRSARHHLRRHAGTLLGGIVATMTITAALLVGRSVQESLERVGRLRIGHAHVAVELAAPAPLPLALDNGLGPLGDAPVARLLVFDGLATLPDRGRRTGRVRVLGVDESFFGFFDARPAAPAEGEVWLSRRLAERLDASPGDELVLRVPMASGLPSDVPLGAAPTAWAAARWTVRQIVADEFGGRFDVRPSVEPPLNAFVHREALAAFSGRPGVANVLLIGRSATVPTLDDLRRAVEEAAGPAGRNFEIRSLPDGGAELRSAGVVLDAAIVDHLTNALSGGRPLLTYFVNAWRTPDRFVPYSFASGVVGEPLPPDVAADEIVVHADLANDLAVRAGDRLRAEYFILDAQQRLVETHTVVRVRAVTTQPRDPGLVPDLPGISQATSCRDWKTSLPLDISRIRPADEDDWSRWRGAPKAWLRYDTAVSLWSNRFGVATAIRWPAPVTTADVERATRRVPLAARFTDVREAARRAARGGPDFTMLFLGLGAFVIVAALLLEGWMFGAALAGREPEIRLLVALGFTRRDIARWLLAETALVALLAAMAGAAAGIALACALVAGLRSVWRDAAGGAPLWTVVPFTAPAIGALLGWLVALLAAAAVIRRHSATPPARADSLSAGRRRPHVSKRTTLALAAIALAAALAVPRIAGRAALERPLPRLAAGALTLLGSGFVGRLWLRSPPSRTHPSPTPFGPHAWRRHPGRTLAALLVPACGWFVVFAVETHRPRTPPTEPRDSPAGGFSALAETSIALPDDPTSTDGRRRWRLDDALDQPGVRVLALRRVEGTAADCRNIQRVDQPPLLGVPTATLDELGAFSWRRAPANAAPGRPWSALALPTAPDEIPAVLDASVATWGLRVRIGDRIPMTDERGRPFALRIVGLLDDTIFQGHLVLDEQRLLERFPSAPRRMLLIEAPAEWREPLLETLADRLEDWGFEWTSTRDRLDSLLDVHRAYLDIFLAFSSLGLALGGLGFGVLAWRTLIERRSELAMLLALGWTRRRLWGEAALDQWLLAWAGLLLGLAAALAAFPPRWEGWASWWRISWIAAAALALIGTLSVQTAVWMLSHGPLLPHLRSE